MSWEFLKGDAIRLTFIFKENDSVYDDSGATKLRVFCYGNKGKTYFFGDEFAKNNGEWIAQFESERTSGNAGASVLTAQLLDADGNLINSANINLLVIESNTTTPFVSSPHFKDDALVEIEQAVADAKVQIDNWSDQSSRLANLEQATQDLQLFKSNSGALHFNKGATASCNSFKNFGNIFSMCGIVQMSAETFSSISGYQRIFGGYSSGNKSTIVLQKAGATSNQLSCRALIYKESPAIDYGAYFDASLVADGKPHCIVCCYNLGTIKVYVDGNLVKTASKEYAKEITPDSFQIGDGNSAIDGISNVAIFNFDMSAEDAPYTLSDYQQGKPIPVECLDTSAEQRALLALENYTLALGSSKKILDYSGNKFDASCSGTIKGDNDTRIQALVDFIKA